MNAIIVGSGPSQNRVDSWENSLTFFVNQALAMHRCHYRVFNDPGLFFLPPSEGCVTDLHSSDPRLRRIGWGALPFGCGKHGLSILAAFGAALLFNPQKILVYGVDHTPTYPDGSSAIEVYGSPERWDTETKLLLDLISKVPHIEFVWRGKFQP
jgi:hypothetical protein